MGIRSFASQSRAAAIALLLAVAATGSATAEPIAIDPKAKPATLIEFKAEPGLGEFVGRAEGRVDRNGARFFLKNLHVMAPLAIQVFAKDPARPVAVSLHRFMWREAEQRGATDENGDWQFIGRIHDEVGIELTAEQPAEFYVLAWRGPEQPTDFGANLYVKADASGGSAGGGGGVPWLAITVVIALAAVAIVFLLTRRGGGAGTASGIIGLTLGLALMSPHAEANPLNADWGIRLAAVEAGLESLQSSFNESQAVVAERLHNQDAMIMQTNQRVADMSSAMMSAILDLDDANRKQDNKLLEMSQQLQIMSDNYATQLAQLQNDVTTLYMLVERDRVAEPDPTFGGVGPMPSNCFDNPACAACFNEVNERLVNQMELYERLRSIYSTHRSFAEYVVMTGDALSGFHQLEQAAWYGIKLDIKQAQMNVTKAYNNKYGEFNKKLDGILRDFGQCEARHGNDDWYERHGKLFYNALIAGYRVYDDTELPF